MPLCCVLLDLKSHSGTSTGDFSDYSGEAADLVIRLFARSRTDNSAASSPSRVPTKSRSRSVYSSLISSRSCSGAVSRSQFTRLQETQLTTDFANSRSDLTSAIGIHGFLQAAMLRAFICTISSSARSQFLEIAAVFSAALFVDLISEYYEFELTGEAFESGAHERFSPCAATRRIILLQMILNLGTP